MRHALRAVPVRRLLALLLLASAIVPGTWLRDPPRDSNPALDLRFTPVPLPAKPEMARLLGPFKLERAWRLTGRHYEFEGFSALVPLGQSRLRALSDKGFMFAFSPPGAPPSEPLFRSIHRSLDYLKKYRDAESATVDPATGTVWIGWEFSNAISRHDPAFTHSQTVEPGAMRGWGKNIGPEAMTRLVDGRFVVLREGFSGKGEKHRHPALLFSGDPVESAPSESFVFSGPEDFSPTAMAQLPDGRVLILMRKVDWPIPPRFSGRIVLADPADIAAGGVWKGKVVAKLAPPLPVDNFEGLAIRPRKDGKLTVWLISDDNGMVLAQRTLLWKLTLDTAKLPSLPKHEKAREKPARSSEKPD